METGIQSSKLAVLRLGRKFSFIGFLFLFSGIACNTFGEEKQRSPNLIFILADDLGFGDIGCFGQSVIQTPRLDQMASEGMKFTQFYAGNTVCAPSRSVLMTGQHMGHTHVRGNAGGTNMLIQSLRAEDITVAEVLREAGYATGLIGKWGLGEVDQPGSPLEQGFDRFFGYANQVHAHNYYPEVLWDNENKKPLRNIVQRSDRAYGGFLGGAATKRIDYSHDLLIEESLRFIKDNQKKPFFLYLALTVPHANNEGRRLLGDGAEVPDYGLYANQSWPSQDKGQAAMITRMDGDVGRLLALLKELRIDDRTLVIFTSDNGPHAEGGHQHEYFDANGPLRGYKRDLYEGGIRVPTIAWWPGKIKPGVSSDEPLAGYDWLPTACELAGVEAPTGIDGISYVPTLLGRPQRSHDYLFWSYGKKKAVRKGAMKAVQLAPDRPLELYDLTTDIGEATDLAERYPQVVAEMQRIIAAAQQPK